MSLLSLGANQVEFSIVMFSRFAARFGLAWVPNGRCRQGNGTSSKKLATALQASRSNVFWKGFSSPAKTVPPKTPAFRPGSAPTALKGGVSNRSWFSMNAAQFNRVQPYVNEARAAGIPALAEGSIAAGAAPTGCYVSPTLFGPVPRDNPLALEDVLTPCWRPCPSTTRPTPCT